MNQAKFINDCEQALGRLAREGGENQETSSVASPGARAAAWPIKIISNDSYNVYNVQTVEIGEPGTIPVPLGGQMQATNMAESFLDQGQLQAGSSAIMFRIGGKNIFYAPV